MPYATTTKAADIEKKVRTHFMRHKEFNSRQVTTAMFYDWINEALDELYQDCGFQPDLFSITTKTDGTYEYAFSGAGTANTFPDEVDEILRVDYEGTPLKIRYLYTDQIIAPTATDTYDADTAGWYEKWDGGVRYLGITWQSITAGTLTIYALRQPVSIASDAAPALQRDFYPLLKNMLIKMVYDYLEEFDKAAIWDGRYVMPGKARMRAVMDKREGRRPTEIRAWGPDDYLE